MTNSAVTFAGGLPPRHRQDIEGRIRPSGSGSVGPLSLMQQRIWYVEQGMPDEAKASFNLCSAQRLTGALQRAPMERAIAALVQRHPALRAVVGRDLEGRPIQKIQGESTGKGLVFEDLSKLKVDERQAHLRARMRLHRSLPFDLVGGALHRFVLFKLAAREHVLLCVTHHLFSDGWSMWVISQDLGELYAAACEARPAKLDPLPVTVLDHAVWQASWLTSPDAQRELGHWAARLQPLPEVLNLPASHPRPAHWTGKSTSVLLDLPLVLMADLRRSAHESGTSVFTWLLACYFVLLARMSGQTDLVVGIPVKGRRDKELAGLVGFFANTLPLRFAIDVSATFSGVTQALRRALEADLAHAEVPFAQLVHGLALPRNDSAHPVYQTMFSFLDLRSRSDQWGMLQRQSMAMPTSGGVEDVSVLVIERQEDVCVEFCYNEDLFSHDVIELMARRYLSLIKGAIAQPSAKGSALPMMDSRERTLVSSWSQATERLQAPTLLPQLVAARIQSRPDALAVTDEVGQTHTYGELGRRAAAVCRWLAGAGWGRGDRVAVLLGQGPQAMVAMLGVLSSGLAYVPMDPWYPEARLAAMLDDAGVKGVVTVTQHAALLANRSLPTLFLDAMDPGAGALSSDQRILPLQGIRAGDPAYVMYTSGSTGHPKGVVVSHGALANFAQSMRERPGMREDDKVLAVTTPSFDISILEWLLPLAFGAQVVVASAEQSRDGEALAALLRRHGITLMQATPSSWRLLLVSGWQGSPCLKKALVGGEGLPLDVAKDLQARVAEVWNMYGPTETTIWSICGRLAPPTDGVHIGRPIGGTSVWIVDPKGEPCPVGVPGEIWIGGAGLAEGYLNQPAATERSFVKVEAEPGHFCRMYRTGDMGKWRPDGQIECLGRLDRQIKVRGVRIEPGDIEHQLMAWGQFTACAVTAMDDGAGAARLVAYVVPLPGVRPDLAVLRQHLRQHLPDAMVPTHLFVIDTMPLLANGKTDWTRLQNDAIGKLSSEQQHGEEPLPGAAGLQTQTQQQLATVWRKVLGVPHVGLDDNFFDLGGHSLLVMQCIGLMESAVGKRVNPRRYVFESLTQLAASYDEVQPALASGAAEAHKPRGFSFFRRKG